MELALDGFGELISGTGLAEVSILVFVELALDVQIRGGAEFIS